MHGYDVDLAELSPPRSCGCSRSCGRGGSSGATAAIAAVVIILIIIIIIAAVGGGYGWNRVRRDVQLAQTVHRNVCPGDMKPSNDPFNPQFPVPACAPGGGTSNCYVGTCPSGPTPGQPTAGPTPSPPGPTPGPGPPTGPSSKPSFLVGNWYYNYGLRCVNDKQQAGHADPTDVAAWLSGPGGEAGDAALCNCAPTSDYLTAYNKVLPKGKKKYTQNTAFYLGSGFYESDWACANIGSWKYVTQLKNTSASNVPNYPINIINFGGWGCCPNDPGCNVGKGIPVPDGSSDPTTAGSWCNTFGPLAGDAKQAPKCSPLPSKIETAAPNKHLSNGPNCVWNDVAVNNLPKGKEIASAPCGSLQPAGWQGVSVDIEGVASGVQNHPEAFTNAIIAKFQDYKKILGQNFVTILTIPGFGVKKYDQETGATNDTAMAWLTPELLELTDFVCLMYYARIDDTRTTFTSPSGLLTSLKTWTGGGGYGLPKNAKLSSQKIILGMSFGNGDQITDYFTSETVKLAQGGFTAWAYTGGLLAWGKQRLYPTKGSWANGSCPVDNCTAGGGGGGPTPSGGGGGKCGLKKGGVESEAWCGTAISESMCEGGNYASNCQWNKS
jgi:hypothetical protein